MSIRARFGGCVVLAASVAAFSPSPADARKWTDSSGKHSVEAEFVELADGVVRLRIPDGRIMRIPLDRLSPADQQLVRQATQQPMEQPARRPARQPVRSGPGAQPTGGGQASWPRFHGPRGDNISTETGLLASWPDGGPKMIWEADGLGDGFSSMAIADGTIYTAGNRDGKTVVTALNLDGSRKWTAENGPAWTANYEGTRGTPTVDGDRVYHESPLGDLVCLGARTGERMWGGNILQGTNGENIQWALAESVLVDGNNLICCPCGKKASVAAIDKKTGQPVWAARGVEDKAGYASPVAIECGGLRIILTMTSGAVIGANARNGDLLFRYPHKTNFDVNATNPIYHEGHVFITSGYGSGSEMLKLDVRGNQASVTKKWENKDLDNHHGGVVLYEGHLYGADSKGNWICLDWNTGRKVYAEKGVGKGSLTLAGGMLYTYSENNEMGLAKATPDGLTLVGRFRVPKGGDGNSWAHPVVCGGRLYLRHADKLYAYDIKAN